MPPANHPLTLLCLGYFRHNHGVGSRWLIRTSAFNTRKPRRGSSTLRRVTGAEKHLRKRVSSPVAPIVTNLISSCRDSKCRLTFVPPSPRARDAINHNHQVSEVVKAVSYFRSGRTWFAGHIPCASAGILSLRLVSIYPRLSAFRHHAGRRTTAATPIVTLSSTPLTSRRSRLIIYILSSLSLSLLHGAVASPSPAQTLRLSFCRSLDLS